MTAGGAVLAAGARSGRAQPGAALPRAAEIARAAGPAVDGVLTPGRVALVYERRAGAESCDGERAFRAWLSAEIGGDPFVRTGSVQMTVRMSAARTADGFEVALGLEDARGQEIFRDKRYGRACNDALDRITIVLLLDLFGLRPPEVDETAARPPDCAECARPDALETLRREVVRLRLSLSRARVEAQERWRSLEERMEALEDGYRRRMDVSFALSASAFMTLGLTNNVGAGVLAGGEVHSGIFAMGLEARFTFPSAFGVGEFPDDTKDYSRFQGALVPCLRYWYLFGCAVLTAGMEISHNPRLEPPTDVGWVWEVGPRLGGELPLGDMLALRLWGEVLFNPYPTVYHYGEGNELLNQKQIPSVAGFVGAGVVFHFGKKK